MCFGWQRKIVLRDAELGISVKQIGADATVRIRRCVQMSAKYGSIDTLMYNMRRDWESG